MKTNTDDLISFAEYSFVWFIGCILLVLVYWLLKNLNNFLLPIGKPVASNSYATKPKLLIPDTYKNVGLVHDINEDKTYDHAEAWRTNNLRGRESVHYEIWDGWAWCGDNRNYPISKFHFETEAEAMEIAQLRKTNPKLVSPMITDEHAEELKLKTYTIQRVERSNIISI